MAQKENDASSKKRGRGLGLAELRAEDKAKVAKLINQAIQAFEENQSLKQILEKDRDDLPKVGSRAQFKPSGCALVKEESRIEVTDKGVTTYIPAHDGLALSNETQQVSKEKQNLGNKRGEDVARTSTCEEELEYAKEQHLEGLQTEGSKPMDTLTQPYPLEHGGKENKEPDRVSRLYPHDDSVKCNDDKHEIHQNSIAPKRPQPRPLPNLLTNILQYTKNIATLPSTNCSESFDQGHQSFDTIVNIASGYTSGPSLSLQGSLQSKPALPLEHSTLIRSSPDHGSALSLDSTKQWKPNSNDIGNDQRLLAPPAPSSVRCGNNNQLRSSLNGQLECSHMRSLNPYPISQNLHVQFRSLFASVFTSSTTKDPSMTTNNDQDEPICTLSNKLSYMSVDNEHKSPSHLLVSKEIENKNLKAIKMGIFNNDDQSQRQKNCSPFNFQVDGYGPHSLTQDSPPILVEKECFKSANNKPLGSSEKDSKAVPNPCFIQNDRTHVNAKSFDFTNHEDILAKVNNMGLNSNEVSKKKVLIGRSSELKDHILINTNESTQKENSDKTHVELEDRFTENGDEGRASCLIPSSCTEETESHWTPEAIERRNSFYRIPVLSPKPFRNEISYVNEQQGLVTNNVFHGNVNRNTEIPSLTENLAKQCESGPLDTKPNNKPFLSRPPRASKRASKCIKCSRVVRSALQKYQQSRPEIGHTHKLSKCPKFTKNHLSINQTQQNTDSKGNGERRDQCCSTESKKSRHIFCKRQIHSCKFEGDDITNSTCAKYSSCKGRSGESGVKKKTRKTLCISDNGEKSKSTRVACSHCINNCKDLLLSIDPSIQSLKSRDVISLNPSAQLPSKDKKEQRTTTVKEQDCITKVCGFQPGFQDHRRNDKALHSHVNHDVLDVLLQLNGERTRPERPFLLDETHHGIQLYKDRNACEFLHKQCRERYIDEWTKEDDGNFYFNAEELSSIQHQDAHTRETYLHHPKVSNLRKVDHERVGRGGIFPTKYTCDMDGLLKTFIKSNAECLAELMKCLTLLESGEQKQPSLGSLPIEEDFDIYEVLKRRSGKRDNKSGTLNLMQRTTRLEDSETDDRHPIISLASLSRGLLDHMNCAPSPERPRKYRGPFLCRSTTGQSHPNGMMIDCPIMLPNMTKHRIAKCDAGRVNPSIPLPLIGSLENCSSTERSYPNPHNDRHQRDDSPWMPPLSRSMEKSKYFSITERPENEMTNWSPPVYDPSLYKLVKDIEGQRQKYWATLNQKTLGKEQDYRRAGISERQRGE